jgi:hypothetical protein
MNTSGTQQNSFNPVSGFMNIMGTGVTGQVRLLSFELAVVILILIAFIAVLIVQKQRVARDWLFYTNVITLLIIAWTLFRSRSKLIMIQNAATAVKGVVSNVA